MSDNTVLPGSGETIADEDIDGVKFQKMKLVDSTPGSTIPVGTRQNPLFVNDESVALLRRMVKLLESQSATDIAQRKKVTLDAISGSLTLGTVTTLTGITNALPSGTNTIGNITVGGMDHKQFIDVSRATFANCIRNKLTFA